MTEEQKNIFDTWIFPFELCYAYKGNCFICSGIWCAGLIELLGHKLSLSSYEDR